MAMLCCSRLRYIYLCRHARPLCADLLGSEYVLLDNSAGEVLTEVGNMLLSACLGVFGNILQVRVTFSVPRLHLDSFARFLTSITVGDSELQYAVLITASFRIVDQGVDGRIVIVLGVSSLDLLIQAVERWDVSQSPA